MRRHDFLIHPLYFKCACAEDARLRNQSLLRVLGRHLEFAPNCWTLGPASGRPFVRRRSTARAAPSSAYCGTPPWHAGRSGLHSGAGYAAAPLRKSAHPNLKNSIFFSEKSLWTNTSYTSFLDAKADASRHQHNKDQAGENSDDGTDIRVERRVGLRLLVDRAGIQRSYTRAGTNFYDKMQIGLWAIERLPPRAAWVNIVYSDVVEPALLVATIFTAYCVPGHRPVMV